MILTEIGAPGATRHHAEELFLPRGAWSNEKLKNNSGGRRT
jgi:hypothetical protein